MSQTFHRDRLTWLAYLVWGVYGYFINAFGPITPFLKDELGVSYTVSSLHFTAFAAGILGAGLGSPWLVRRIGRLPAIRIGAAGLSLGAALLLLGRTPALTIGASFLMGLLGSLILAIVPGLLADRHGGLTAVAMSEANVICSLLAAAAPLVVGWCARSLGEWRWALAVMALAPLLLWLVLDRGRASDASAPAAPGQARGRLPLRYWVTWFALMLAIAVEFCMVYWSADYLEQVLGLDKADAAQAVSVFLIAMIAGRAAGSRLVRRLAGRGLIAGTILLAGAGFFIFWRAEAVAAGLAGLFLTGLGVANLYPLLISQAIASAQGASVEASGRATLASGTAILALPLLLGRLADAAGIGPAYALVPALLALVCVVAWAAGRTDSRLKGRSRPRGPAAPV